MRRAIIAAATLAISMTAVASIKKQANSLNLQDKNNRFSYTVGVNLGTDFKRQDVILNSQAVSRGIHDAQSGKKLLLTKQEMQQTVNKFQKEIFAKRLAAFKSQSESNKKIGEKFLNENKSKPGVKVTSSGLQYKVLTSGKGVTPVATDTVVVEYTGRFINGKVFDTTDGRGKPVTFKLNEVIPGWTEALQLMNEGSVYEVYIPSDLAYGSEGVGVGGPIGPNETLIFKIKLIKVKRS